MVETADGSRQLGQLVAVQVKNRQFGASLEVLDVVYGVERQQQRVQLLRARNRLEGLQLVLTQIQHGQVTQWFEGISLNALESILGYREILQAHKSTHTSWDHTDLILVQVTLEESLQHAKALRNHPNLVLAHVYLLQCLA